MAVSVKLVAIVVVAVVAVAGAGAAIVLMNKDDGKDYEKEYIDVKTSLGVFGNANGDAVMGDKDIEIIQGIINGTEDKTKYPLADANQDGDITDADIDLVKKMINRDACDVFVLCVDQEEHQQTVKVGFPLKNYVPVASNMNAVSLYISAADYVAGVFGINYEHFESAFKDHKKYGGSATDIDDGWANFIAHDGELQKEGKGIGAVIVDVSKGGMLSADQLSQLSAAGIPALFYSVTDAKMEVSAALTIGFLLGGKPMDKSLEYANKSWEVFNKIDSITSNLTKEQKSSVIAISMGNKVPKNSSDSYDTIREAGGIPYWEVNAAFKTKFDKDKSTTLSSKETLTNYSDADAILSVRSIDGNLYSLKDKIVTTWDTYYEYFNILDNYDKLIYVNNLLPGALKLAYMVEALYPDKIEAGYADGLFAEFAGICQYLDGCTVDNTVTSITYDDYVALGGTHKKATAAA